METIRVNMTPCEDIKTIHASQNDNEAREWGFELHNNGEKIDSSSISDQLVFKAYKGGTEEILPTNGSTPTTSPFKGDIKYPQGLLSDQEFTYRQSPTEEDGLANIVGIKGQTLKWNQLASVVGEQTGTNGLFDTNVYIYSGHKYLMSVEANVSSGNMYLNIFYNDGTSHNYQVVGTTSGKHTLIFDCVYTAHGGSVNTQGNFWFYAYNVSSWKNLMLFDLTAMGIDSLTNAEILQWFADYFPLSYYSFNSGSLIPFMGNGIKTVGKNLYNLEDVYESVAQLTVEGNKLTIVGTVRPSARFVLPSLIASGKLGNTLTLSWNLESLALTNPTIFCGFIIRKADNTFRYVSNGNKAYGRKTISVTLADGETIVRVDFNGNDSATNYGTQTMVVSDIQLEIGSTATSFEPYTESVTSLPISTYFPNGMKSAGSVYDELTETKAITRIGSVDLGTLTYVREAPASGHPDWPLFYASVPNALGKYGTNGNTQICAKYTNRSSSTWVDKTIGFGAASTNINIADTTFADYTVDQVKQALSGVILYYQLATSTETSFTTASLVTENAEIPLSNENGTLIGRCTEQLSENPGFIDAKIKLADADGECYSNKIQLHVERKPS